MGTVEEMEAYVDNGRKTAGRGVDALQRVASDEGFHGLFTRSWWQRGLIMKCKCTVVV